MKSARDLTFRLLLLGVGRRLAGAALVVLILWAGFWWATTPPGGLG